MTELFQGFKAQKACSACDGYQYREKQHHCKEKNALTERARIIGTDRADCWKPRKRA